MRVEFACRSTLRVDFPWILTFSGVLGGGVDSQGRVGADSLTKGLSEGES